MLQAEVTNLAIRFDNWLFYPSALKKSACLWMNLLVIQILMFYSLMASPSTVMPVVHLNVKLVE